MELVVPQTSEDPWFVVQARRHREVRATLQLIRDGIDAYCPLIAQWPRPAVGGEVAPMFPGYLFVRASPHARMSRLMLTPGVRTVVTFGAGPAELDGGVIEFLRHCQDADGIIRPKPPGAGTAVRIVNGPFRGITAVLESSLGPRERVCVLMNLLQRTTRVELPATWVRRA